MTATQRTISPEERIANVQATLLRFVRRLHDHWGVTMRQARVLVERCRSHRLGRRRLLRDLERLSDAWAAVSSLDQWRELKTLHAAGRLDAIVTSDDDVPF